MTFDEEKILIGRRPLWVIEMDMDFCSLTYGVGACTAAGAVGSECFQTRSSTQDATNYDGGGANVITNRFMSQRSDVPVSIDAIPSVIDVDLTPTKIAPGEGLGERGSVVIKFQDEPMHDRGRDPYVATRSYDSATQGTFWGKWKARNKYYQGRIMRVMSGYVTDPFDLVTNFTTRTYVIEKVAGPNAQGIVTVTGKDVLKLADDNRSLCPLPNTGVLDANINAVVGTATLSPAGIGNTEYAASGTLSIGSEVMTFTRAADVLTITRGQDGSTASTHNADDLVQQAYVQTNARMDDIIYDLATNFTPIDSSFIPFTDWQEEFDTYMVGSVASVLILEPTGVKTLLDEVCNQFLIALWFQDTDAEIKFKAYVPVMPPIYTQVTDDNGMIKGTLDQTDDPDRRITQIYVRYGRRDPTKPLDEDNNYRKIQGFADINAGSTEQYGDDRIITVHSRWFTALGDVLRFGSRTLSRYRDTPKIYTLTVDMKESDLETGDVFELTADQLQLATGAVDVTPMQILQAKEVRGGDRMSFLCEEHRFEKRYGGISPDGMDVYTAATDAEQDRYIFISQDDGFMTNGDEGYAIL